MCGIAGFTGGGDDADLRRMTDALAHRGPDAEGHWCDPDSGVWLGHRRLSVVDPECGHQPMASGDGQLVVVFNGEIYNHAALRRDLEGCGHRFVSDHSDTEVLLHAYREWGDDFVGRLNGMWAFALLDRPRRRLLLSRDRFGQKPLYYAQCGGSFVFASELSALASHPKVGTRRSRNALRKYFAYGYVPAPYSILEDAYKLPAGFNLGLALRDGVPRTKQYFEFRLEADEAARAPTLAESGEELSRLLDRAVRRRLLADVPLGVFLSGGIDSSAVAAFASRARGGVGLRTFSIGFDEPSFDESAWAAHVARHVGSQHRNTAFSQERARTALEAVAAGLDEPLADSSILPTYLLCGEARRDVTVALGGDGADELFGGYDPFRALRLADVWSRFVPRPLHRAVRLLAACLPTSHRYLSFQFKLERTLRGLGHARPLWNPVWLGPLEPSELQDLFQEPVDVHEVYAEAIAAWERSGAGSLEDRTLQFFTRLYLQNDILVKIDRASMLHSLEVRSPFLDVEVAEFAARLPTSHKVSGRETKRALRRALVGLVPEDVLGRRKQGFAMPVGRWLRDGHLSLETALRETDLCSEFVARRLRSHRRGLADHRLYLFAHWLQGRVDARYPAGESDEKPGPSVRTASALSGPSIDTSLRFGFEWDRYREMFPHYEEQFRGWIEPLEPRELQGRDVLDAGCGMGRNSLFCARLGARSVVAVDQAELAVAAARQVLSGMENVRVERTSLYELDYREAFDLVFCIGVIHHLELPERALGRLARALRPGGRLVVWLYGYEGNELWVRFFRLVHPVLRRLPPRIVHALAHALSVPIFLGLKIPWRRSPYLARVSRYPFRHLHKIVFDQLLPDIAHYYRRHEVEALFRGLDLKRVGIHHNRGYSWTVVCEK
jgi:asparagine synthase (glutamine-hydrolysing)